MKALLEVRNITVAYGGIQAVRDLSLDVAEGEMVCLIGANGAGKTTTLKAISGLLAPACGTIFFDGQAISGLAPHAVAKRVPTAATMPERFAATPSGFTACCRGWQSDDTKSPGCCPAANNRCWRWVAP
jgi:ABC-type cobalamin/Fe3+-siderophores transport system ATPase subunit